MSEENKSLSEEELEQVDGGKALSRRKMDDASIEDGSPSTPQVDDDGPSGGGTIDIWDPPVE